MILLIINTNSLDDILSGEKWKTFFLLNKLKLHSETLSNCYLADAKIRLLQKASFPRNLV